MLEERPARKPPLQHGRGQGSRTSMTPQTKEQVRQPYKVSSAGSNSPDAPGVMLQTRIASCQHCGAEMCINRRTKSYCSDRCRKKAARGDLEQKAESRCIVESLRSMGCVGQVWSVYPWDDSPRIIALIIPRQTALDQLNLGSVPMVTDADLTRALRDCDVADYASCGNRLEAAIKDFYAARKDRRLRQGYTPTDKPKTEH
jgi:hypothetical protein